jgi:hypothetical protein
MSTILKLPVKACGGQGGESDSTFHTEIAPSARGDVDASSVAPD